jgi:hypothetical protein
MVTHPLLADVLAEPFAIHNGQRHTMGRLMVAGFQKGDPGSRDIDDPAEMSLQLGMGTVVPHRYEPSWAPGVVASTYIKADTRTPLIHNLVGVRVECASAGSFAVVNNGDMLQVRIDDQAGTHEEIHVLSLGQELWALQATIASTARQFFETHHVATHPK